MRLTVLGLGFLLGLSGFPSTTARAAETKPVMIQRVAPEYPPELRAQRVIGSAQLLFQVDETGQPKDIRIVGESLPAFGAAGKRALEQCRYQPGTKDGQPRAMEWGLTVEFTFSDAELAKMEAERTPEVLPPGPALVEAYETSDMPELKKEIRPELPAGMRAGRIENAVVRFVVDEQGVPRDVHLLVTTAAQCGAPALAAVQKWRFSPGKREGQVVRVVMEVPLTFLPDNRWATGARIKPGVSRDVVTALPGKEMVEFIGLADEEKPKPVHREELSYPDELYGSMSGTVVMECIINPYGVVTHARAINTTNQYFTIAAERCFSRWRFTPPKKNGRPVYLRVLQRANFILIP